MLANQSGPFNSSWDGQSLTKAGAGTLILSATNTYTGNTNITAGMLQTGADDTFAQSARVTVADGATLNLNGFNQTANSLNGAGTITLGSAILTANNSADTTFSGAISGTGSLLKTGGSALTLSGVNSYSGGTEISGGKIIATNGGALGSNTITNNAELELAFTSNGTLSNKLDGNGTLTKSGSATTVTLTGAGSQQGAVNVNAGTLVFAQTGVFNATSLSTVSGATTDIAADSTLKLSGALTQSSDSTLTVALGTIQPVIWADNAALNGTLNISGFGASAPTKASDLTTTTFTIVHTDNGITGDFTDVSFGGSASPVDYLTLSGGLANSNKDYNIGFGLTWQAGTTKGNGTFTLADSATFEVDTVLTNQSGTFTSGWDGQSLTKAGVGTLILSKANTYSGNTNINAGTLQAGAIDAFAQSARVTVASGATLDLNDLNQTANNLNGAGTITLGSATLNINNNADTTFSGAISGTGSLIKTGSNVLTLSGVNSYSGGTTISAGKVIATNGDALGSGAIANNVALELAFADHSTLSNVLSGNGILTKTGNGIATLTSGGSQGVVSVDAGTLMLADGVTLNTTGNYTTADGASTTLHENARLDVDGHFNQQGTLNVIVDASLPPLPVIDATTATIGSNAVFNLAGYSADPAATASELANTVFTVIHTASSGDLSGTFNTIHIGGSSVNDIDYLEVSTLNNGQNFDVGIGLSWYMDASSDPDKAHGTFTLTNASDAFDMDVVLTDRTVNAVTGWDGISLTKKGLGTLQLSQQNTYTGDTLIQAGTLRAGIADAIAASNQVIVSGGATFDLNNYDQHVNMLSGAGNVILGNADLTADYAADATFSGVISGTGAFTKTGVSALLLTGDHTYSGATTISSGTLQLGNGGASGSVAGDIINNGQLIIDRSADYAYNGIISGNGNLIQQGSGSVMFSQSQSYTGTTDINAGALILENGAQLSGTQLVTVSQGAILGGYGGVSGDIVNHGLLAVADAVPGYADSPAGTFTVGGNLINNGEIRMASPLPASTLIINGNYIGNNGLLTLSTVLGGDSSATDKLIVHGDTSGTTRVVVNNSSGIGAQTTNGIEIIQVDGQSDGQFTLSNRVVAGAYEYGLYQGLPDQMNGNWYLRSESQNGKGEWWRPEIGGYLGNQSLTALMQVHTLFDRQGAQYSQDSGSFWVRVTGGQVDSKAAHGNVDMDSDYTLVQLGADLATYRNGTQQLQIGLMGNWGQGNTDSTGNRNSQGSQSTANSKVDGYALGMYATWFADADTQRGLYVDSWLQYGRYDNKVTGQGMRTDNYDSTLWTVSLESGYTIALGNESSRVQWRLTPQAQVIYGQYSADRFTDVSGTMIDGQDNNLWTTRLGLRLSGQMQVNNDQLIQPFAEMNWWHNGQNSSVALTSAGATTVVSEDVPKDRAELKMGVQGQFSKNWSGWAHVGWQSDFQDYQRLEGMAGLRYVW